VNIHKAILYGEDLLRKNGVEPARWNAERLLILALRQERIKIYSDLIRELTVGEMQAYEGLLKKRAEHYPLAYLEGTQEFFGRQFYVNESVLIPRPETEEIIHAVLELSLPPSSRILDVGAGSGNVCVTLALEVPNSFVVALELHEPALEILRKNAQGHIEIVRGDFVHSPFHAESFDVIASNPPYVEADSFHDLPAETRWEPQRALAAESLEQMYISLLAQAARLLKPRGNLVFEIGYGQSQRIQAVSDAERQFKLIQIRRDHQAIPRVFVLQKL